MESLNYENYILYNGTTQLIQNEIRITLLKLHSQIEKKVSQIR